MKTIYINEFFAENPQYLSESPQGSGSTCREAYYDAIEFLSQGDELDGISDESIEKAWLEFVKEYGDDIKRLDLQLSEMYEKAEKEHGESALNEVDMYIYCFVSIYEEEGD